MKRNDDVLLFKVIIDRVQQINLHIKHNIYINIVTKKWLTKSL